MAVEEASLQYALDKASKMLPAYEKAFGQKYPLSKLDLVAVPDFAAVRHDMTMMTMMVTTITIRRCIVTLDDLMH